MLRSIFSFNIMLAIWTPFIVKKKKIDVIVAGSFKSQLIDYFRGCIVSWEKVEGSIWQFYDN